MNESHIIFSIVLLSCIVALFYFRIRKLERDNETLSENLKARLSGKLSTMDRDIRDSKADEIRESRKNRRMRK